MPNSPEGQSRTSLRKEVKKQLDSNFWIPAVDTLRTHETDVLERQLFRIADAAPHVSLPAIRRVTTLVKDAYAGKTRKYTGEPEVNHALQVATLLALHVGYGGITTRSMATALGHDFEEDTDRSPMEIANAAEDYEIARGISILSHKTNNVPKYPNPEDKYPYFSTIVQGDKKYPGLYLLPIKGIDQLTVANGPLTAQELSDPSFQQEWEDMSETKAAQMEQLHTMVDNNLRAERLLREARAFTLLRMEPKEAMPALLIYQRMREDV